MYNKNIFKCCKLLQILDPSYTLISYKTRICYTFLFIINKTIYASDTIILFNNSCNILYVIVIHKG